MESLYVGCLGHRGGLDAYFRDFNVMELGPEVCDMRPGTLTRWREAAPAEVQFVPPVAPGLVEAGFAGQAAEAAWKATLDYVERLGAGTVLLRTPARFRPTRQNRDALVAFFEGRLPAGLTVAWRADGLWEGQPDARDEICTALGFLPVVDPLRVDEEAEQPLPPGARFYWRIMGGQGMQGRLSDHDLDTLLELCADRQAGHVVFTAPQMRGEARRFAQLARATLLEDEDEALDEDQDDEEPDDDEAGAADRLDDGA